VNKFLTPIQRVICLSLHITLGQPSSGQMGHESNILTQRFQTKKKRSCKQKIQKYYQIEQQSIWVWEKPINTHGYKLLKTNMENQNQFNTKTNFFKTRVVSN
jgi:hypothetical protein